MPYSKENRIKNIALGATADLITILKSRVANTYDVKDIREAQIRRTIEKACIKSVETIAGEIWRK